MYRVCLTKEGKLIEMQSGGRSDDKELEAMRLNTLKQNAFNAGYAEDEIEVKWVTDEEWAVIEAEINKPDLKAVALSALREIDIASVRSIREWVVTQPGAPKFLIDYEAKAKVERTKLE